jgi:hypothetical protein
MAYGCLSTSRKNFCQKHSKLNHTVNYYRSSKQGENDLTDLIEQAKDNPASAVTDAYALGKAEFIHLIRENQRLKAALAAKEELHAAALQVLERHHQKELAAEREKLIGFIDFIEQHGRTSPTQSNILVIEKLKRQLAAERERAEHINAELVLRGCQLAAERESHANQIRLMRNDYNRAQSELAAEREKVKKEK